MSGTPYPAAVERLSEGFRELERTREKIARLEKTIATNQFDLKEAQESEQKAREQIRKLMSEMDVLSPGNMGYEDRLMWLLRELNTQAERYGRDQVLKNPPKTVGRAAVNSASNF